MVANRACRGAGRCTDAAVRVCTNRDELPHHGAPEPDDRGAAITHDDRVVVQIVKLDKRELPVAVAHHGDKLTFGSAKLRRNGAETRNMGDLKSALIRLGQANCSETGGWGLQFG